MSTGFSEMMSSRNTTPPVSDSAGSTPTAASLTGGKEEKKRAEKSSTPDITKGGWSEVLLRSFEFGYLISEINSDMVKEHIIALSSWN